MQINGLMSSLQKLLTEDLTIYMLNQGVLHARHDRARKIERTEGVAYLD